MEPRTAICPICGRSFTPATASSKYCSAACRHEGRRQARKAWEDRTDYREKQRAAAQEYRDQKAAADALEAQARQGDALAALLMLSRAGKKASAEYWEAFKAYETARTAGQAAPRVMFVNGVAIGDPDFSLKVTITIQETGRIITALR